MKTLSEAKAEEVHHHYNLPIRNAKGTSSNWHEKMLGSNRKTYTDVKSSGKGQ